MWEGVRDPNDYPDRVKPSSKELKCPVGHQETRLRDASVAGKMPDGDKAAPEHRAAGEQGFSTPHKSNSLNTVAFRKSAHVGI